MQKIIRAYDDTLIGPKENYIYLGNDGLFTTVESGTAIRVNTAGKITYNNKVIPGTFAFDKSVTVLGLGVNNYKYKPGGSKDGSSYAISFGNTAAEFKSQIENIIGTTIPTSVNEDYTVLRPE